MFIFAANNVGDMLTNIDLRAARRAAKLSQEEAGKLINVKRDTILSYEKGNSKPSIAVIEQLLRAYGFNICLLSSAEFGILQGIKAVIEQNTPKTAKNRAECGE